jgi:hypothetical protein
MKNPGFFGFYRGLPSMVYFAFPKAAIRFSSFETCSALLTGPPGNEDKYNLGSMKGFVAGLGAGTMEAIFVTTPQETIKVRLINDAFRQDGKPPQYKSFFHGVKTIVGEYGLSGIYKGLFPTVIKVATAQATRFGVFQYIPSDMVRCCGMLLLHRTISGFLCLHDFPSTFLIVFDHVIILFSFYLYFFIYLFIPLNSSCREIHL